MHRGPKDLGFGRGLLEALTALPAEARGAFSQHEMMVDRPVIERAKRDADLDATAIGAISSKFRNTGRAAPSPGRSASAAPIEHPTTTAARP